MKNIIKWSAILIAVILVALVGAVTYISYFLPNLSVDEKIVIEVTSERVKRGKYLANHVNLCMDCHSTRDFSILTGPPVAGTAGAGGERFDQSMGFPGTFISRNITPHSLSNWSDGEIYRAITSGISKDGSVIFPVMPWNAYSKMATEDIYSIIAYLRQLTPIEKGNSPSKADFPVSLIMNTFPLPASPQPIPDKADRIAYGKYITNAASCVECHTKMDNQGNSIAGMEFAGGQGFKMPGNGMVYSANLTPATTGLKGYTEDSFVAKFKMYVDSAYVAPTVNKNEYQTLMPWMMYAGMEEGDLRAIYAYLSSLKPIENEVVKFIPEM